MALYMVDQNQAHGELVMKCFRFHLLDIALRKRERRSGSEIRIRDRHKRRRKKEDVANEMQSHSGLLSKLIVKENLKRKTIVHQVASKFNGNEPLNCR